MCLRDSKKAPKHYTSELLMVRVFITDLTISRTRIFVSLNRYQFRGAFCFSANDTKALLIFGVVRFVRRRNGFGLRDGFRQGHPSIILRTKQTSGFSVINKCAHHNAGNGRFRGIGSLGTAQIRAASAEVRQGNHNIGSV